MLIHFQLVGQCKSDNSCSLELFCPNLGRGAGGGQCCGYGAWFRGPKPSSSIPPVLHQPLRAILSLHIWLLSLLRDISKHLADASASQCSRWLTEKRGAAGCHSTFPRSRAPRPQRHRCRVRQSVPRARRGSSSCTSSSNRLSDDKGEKLISTCFHWGLGGENR